MSLTTTRIAFDAARDTHTVIPVCREIFADADTPVGIYRKVAASRPGTFLLESAEQGGVWTRFSFVGAGSFGVLTERDGMAFWHSTSEVDQDRLLPGGVDTLAPAEALRAAYERWQQQPIAELPPLASGFVGYLGWETVRQFERLPNRPADGPGLPTQAMSFVSELIVIDHREGSVVLLANVLNDELANDADEQWNEAQRRLDALQRSLAAPAASPLGQLDRDKLPDAIRLTAEADYLADVERSKQYIVDGDIFQVVISQRFDQECTAAPLDVYRVLRHLNPSPYLYLLQCE
ncbi:MAG: anthranilate synthase component I, partial [Leucobacter sp.]|nr:anthranilate synthase component I [Leucobacter sp.]